MLTTQRRFSGVWEYDLSKTTAGMWCLVATPEGVRLAYLDLRRTPGGGIISVWQTQSHSIKGVYAFANLPNRPPRDKRPIYTAAPSEGSGAVCALCGKHRSAHRDRGDGVPLGSPEYCP